MSYYKDQIQYEIMWKVECEKNKILTQVLEELCIDDCGIDLEKETKESLMEILTMNDLRARAALSLLRGENDQ